MHDDDCESPLYQQQQSRCALIGGGCSAAANSSAAASAAADRRNNNSSSSSNKSPPPPVAVSHQFPATGAGATTAASTVATNYVRNMLATVELSESIMNEVPEDNYDLPYHHNHHHHHHPADSGEAVMIKIDASVPLREEPRYPKEKWKTVMSFVMMSVNMMLVTVSLSIVHERLPDRHIYKPLPDIVLDNVAAIDWVLNVSEILIMVQVNACIVLVLFHRHKFIVMRRIFLMMSILYFMRSITMFVTVLPVSNEQYYCSPKSETGYSVALIAQRAFQLMSGFGLSINGKHTYCGDYIYSGHTVMLVLGYLTIVEYSPRRFTCVHWIAWLNALVGVVMVMVAHGHYTIDVLIAYYVTTRLFWSYHTMANNNFLLKQSGPSNYLSREYWFVFFRYFECNVRGPLPNQYEWPLPWPRRFHSKIPNRES